MEEKNPERDKGCLMTLLKMMRFAVFLMAVGGIILLAVGSLMIMYSRLGLTSTWVQIGLAAVVLPCVAAVLLVAIGMVRDLRKGR